MPSRMLLEGACRSACLSDPVTVPTHDIAADGGLGWRQLIKRRAQGVRRCPEGPVSFAKPVMAAKPQGGPGRRCSGRACKRPRRNGVAG